MVARHRGRPGPLKRRSIAAAGIRWQAFARRAPDLGAVGLGLLPPGSVAMLATVSRADHPHLAPVCPVFSGTGVYLSVVRGSPKARDLRAGGAYVLHALPGPEDQEFQVSGYARLVQAPAERDQVTADIPFPAHNKADPIFELRIVAALAVTWQHFGTPDMTPQRLRFRI